LVRNIFASFNFLNGKPEEAKITPTFHHGELTSEVRRDPTFFFLALTVLSGFNCLFSQFLIYSKKSGHSSREYLFSSNQVRPAAAMTH
jgi:hypothetical protein